MQYVQMSYKNKNRIKKLRNAKGAVRAVIVI